MEKNKTIKSSKKIINKSIERKHRIIQRKENVDKIQENIENKNLELLEKINTRKNELQEFENLINNMNDNPQLILESLFFKKKTYNELLNIVDNEIYDMQDFFYQKLKKYSLFNNEHILFDYQKDIFPAPITILYDDIPIFYIDLVNKEYSYILSKTLEKEKHTIEQSENVIDACMKRGSQLVPIKSFITNDYNELSHNFKTIGLAKQNFFNFYLENKKYNGLFEYFKTKFNFYIHFKNNQSKYIDDILKVYDQVNETIEKYDSKKKECENKILIIKEKEKDMSVFSHKLILLLIKNEYSIK